MAICRILRISEIAEVLHTTRPTIYHWLRTGRLPGRKGPGGWLVLEQDLEHFLKGDHTKELEVKPAR